jgi:hypothetical protein
MRNHAPILLQQIKTKILTTKQNMLLYNQVKRKQNTKQSSRRKIK